MSAQNSRNTPGRRANGRALLRRALLAAAFLFPAALAALDFNVLVINAETKKPVEDANVVILEARRRFTTLSNGAVSAQVPRAGFYTVRVIATGYKVKQIRENIISSGQVLRIEIEPREKSTTGGGGGTVQVGRDASTVTVTGEKKKTKLSRYQVRLDEIKRLPGAFGEALRGLETLPGINAPSFGSGEIVVRGANENANFYVIDDLPVGYAFHFFAVNSVIHNDIISTIDIYTGAYPVHFGDATGGIIEITTIDEVEKFGGHAAFSLWSANALFKGPLGDGGYWIVAGRGSYLERTLGQFLPDGIQAPRYGDAQVKLKYYLNPYNSVSAYVLGAKDTFGAQVKSEAVWDPTTDVDPLFDSARVALDRAYHTEAVRWQWRLKPKKAQKDLREGEENAAVMSNTLTVFYHENLFFIDGSIGILDARQKLKDGYAAIKDIFDWEIYRKGANLIGLEIGFEARSFRYYNSGRTIRQLEPNDPAPDPFDSADFVSIPVSDSHITSYNSAHLMTVLQTGGVDQFFTDGAEWNVEFKPGVRVDYFGLTKQRVVDPRGTLSATLHKTTLIGGAGVYHRVPDPNQYSPSSGNPNLKMERAEHYGVGVEQTLGNWTFKVEGFRHYFTDIVVTDPYITTAVRANPDPYERYRTPWLYNDRLGDSNDGTGFSEGFEVYIKRSKEPRADGWYGWLSYTWSRSIRNDHQHIVSKDEERLALTYDERRILNQYDNTRDHYASFDRTHIINLVFGYKFSREWQLGARWKYQSSAAFTIITGDDGGRKLSSGRVLFNPESPRDLKNTHRLKPYHRLDIRLDRFLHYGWGFGNVFAELLNVYVRDNPENYAFDRKQPYSAANPYVQDGFGHLEASVSGQRVRTPIFNFGVEVQF